MRRCKDECLDPGLELISFQDQFTCSSTGNRNVVLAFDDINTLEDLNYREFGLLQGYQQRNIKIWLFTRWGILLTMAT